MALELFDLVGLVFLISISCFKRLGLGSGLAFGFYLETITNCRHICFSTFAFVNP